MTGSAHEAAEPERCGEKNRKRNCESGGLKLLGQGGATAPASQPNDGFDCGDKVPATLASRQQHSGLLLRRNKENPVATGWRFFKIIKQSLRLEVSFAFISLVKLN